MNDETMTNETTMEPTMEPQAPQVDLSSPEAEAIIQQRVAAELAQMKENMNAMDARLKEAQRVAVTLEEEKKQAHIAQLEAEGKTNEATQLKLDEALERVNVLSKINTELTRDHSVDKILGEHDFRNTTAREMARQSVIGQLKQNEDGAWVHATGASIGDFVQTFAKDEENAFLFKPKQSTGAAAMQQAAGQPQGQPSDKPITEMSFEDFMKSAPAPQGGDSWGF